MKTKTVKMIPLAKQSKKSQRQFYADRRGSWNGLNPVTRRPRNPKAYNRAAFSRERPDDYQS